MTPVTTGLNVLARSASLVHVPEFEDQEEFEFDMRIIDHVRIGLDMNRCLAAQLAEISTKHEELRADIIETHHQIEFWERCLARINARFELGDYF